MTNEPQKKAEPKAPVSAPPNDHAAEKAAQVSPAIIAPLPLIQMTLSDPDALENVRRRTAKAKAARGRSTLRIPLASAVSVSGGISIPK